MVFGIHQLRPLDTLRNMRRNQEILQLTHSFVVLWVLGNTIFEVLLGEFVTNCELFADCGEVDVAFEEEGCVAVGVRGYGVVLGVLGYGAQGLADRLVEVDLLGLQVHLPLVHDVDTSVVQGQDLVWLEHPFY